MVIEHVPTHWVWIITTSMNACLFCLLRLKFDALWFCHLKSLCKSLYHCRYIRVIIWCCLSMCLNLFLWSRNFSCPEEELVADAGSPRLRLRSWAPPFFCLYIKWLSLLTVLPSWILTHTCGKLTICWKMQFKQEQITWAVSSPHLD